MENLIDEIEDQVVSLLEQIEETRSSLLNTKKKGNVKRVGDIEFDTTRGSSFIKSEYRRLLCELSHLLDIPNCSCHGSRGIRIHGP